MFTQNESNNGLFWRNNPKFAPKLNETKLITSPVMIGKNSHLVSPINSRFSGEAVYIGNLQIFRDDDLLRKNINMAISNAYNQDKSAFVDDENTPVELEEITLPKKASNDSNFIYFIGVSSKDQPGILNLNGEDLRKKGLKTLDEAIVIASLLFKPYHLNGNEKHGVSICLHNLLVLSQAGSDKIKSVDKRLSPEQDFADLFSGDNENTKAIL